MLVLILLTYHKDYTPCTSLTNAPRHLHLHHLIIFQTNLHCTQCAPHTKKKLKNIALEMETTKSKTINKTSYLKGQ